MDPITEIHWIIWHIKCVGLSFGTFKQILKIYTYLVLGEKRTKQPHLLVIKISIICFPMRKKKINFAT